MRMNLKRLAAPAIAFAMFASTAVLAHAQGYPPPPPPPGYGQPYGQPVPYGARGWDAPPGELRDFARQGYIDGVQGAERDWQNHRIWNVRNRDEFRHPHVPGNVAGSYREAFKRGYYATASHYQPGFVGR